MKQNIEQLKKEFEKMVITDNPSVGVRIRLVEVLSSGAMDTIWNFFLPHLISSDEIKREAYKNCIRIIKAQTVIRTDLGEVATKELVNIETLGRNIVGAIENQYLTQSKEGKINT